MTQKQIDKQDEQVNDLHTSLKKTILTPANVYTALRVLGFGPTKAVEKVNNWCKSIPSYLSNFTSAQLEAWDI